MNNELSVLTGQPVTFTLGGVEYKAKRATLADIGKMNTFKDEKTKKGETANLDLDSTLFLLATLMEPYWPASMPMISYATLGEMIPVQSIGDLKNALEVVGFTMPQEIQTQTKNEVGA